MRTPQSMFVRERGRLRKRRSASPVPRKSYLDEWAFWLRAPDANVDRYREEMASRLSRDAGLKTLRAEVDFLEQMETESRLGPQTSEGQRAFAERSARSRVFRASLRLLRADRAHPLSLEPEERRLREERESATSARALSRLFGAVLALVRLGRSFPNKS
jgi:hypothetical protein